ncbi:zinc finger BED domain-containing protein 1-like isoform X2 [Tachysurus ichikawai]
MPIDSAKAQDITAKIAQMIAMSDLPFVFVENPGFLMLMEHVEPRFEMPCTPCFVHHRHLEFVRSSYISTKPYRTMD